MSLEIGNIVVCSRLASLLTVYVTRTLAARKVCTLGNDSANLSSNKDTSGPPTFRVAFILI